MCTVDADNRGLRMRAWPNRGMRVRTRPRIAARTSRTGVSYTLINETRLKEKEENSR